MEHAIRGKPITVTNPDNIFLDFTYAEDVAEGLALVTLTPNSTNEEFNITRGEGRSLAEAIQCLRGHFPNLEVVVETKDEAFRPQRGLWIFERRRN